MTDETGSPMDAKSAFLVEFMRDRYPRASYEWQAANRLDALADELQQLRAEREGAFKSKPLPKSPFFIAPSEDPNELLQYVSPRKPLTKIPDTASFDCDDMAAAYDAMKEPPASGLPALLETHANRLAEMGRYDIAADVQLASERLAAINAHAEQATEYVLAQINSDLRARIAALEAERDNLDELVAVAYQLAGLVDAPERFLDAFAARTGSVETLLPVTLAEIGALEARDRLIADLVRWSNRDDSGLFPADPGGLSSLIARGRGKEWPGHYRRGEVSDKTLVERLREAADDYVVGSNIGGLMTEAAALIEQLTAKPTPSRDWRSTVMTQTEMQDLIDELTASRDRHERDVDTWRQRYIEKCAEESELRDRIAMAEMSLFIYDEGDVSEYWARFPKRLADMEGKG